jgi:lipopolysaccharide exporter
LNRVAQKLNASHFPGIPMSAQNRSFASSVLLLACGTVAAQFISLLGTPITARLFSPSAFGVAAVFAALTGLVLPVICLRYENSIILPEKDDEAINTLGLSLATAVVITFVTALLLFVFWRGLLAAFHAPELHTYLWLVPISILIGGTFLPLSMWSVRNKRFELLTLSQILSAVTAVGMQIGAGVAGHVGAGWLIGASLVGTTIGTLVLATHAWRHSSELVMRHLRLSGMWHALKRYQRFPRYSSGATVLNGLSWQLPVFFLSGFFSADVVGQFSLGNRVIRAPMNLVGGNIAKVFAQRAAEAQHNRVLAETVEKILHYLVALTLFPCLLLSLVGKDLFIVVFSAKWAEAGVYSQILSLWVCVWFISSPLSIVFVVLEEQRLEFGINVLILVSRFLSLLVGGLSGNPRIALILFSASGVLVYGYYCFAILKKAGVPISKAFRVFVPYVLSFVPAAMLILLLEWLSVRAFLVVGVALILLVLYYVGLIYVDERVRREVASMLRLPLRRTNPLYWTPAEQPERVR